MSNYTPIHPGIMAHFLLKEEGYRCVEDEKYYDEARLVEVKKNGVVGWETILRLPLDFVYYGKGNVDYIIAYNLVKLLPFTTIDWWMSRQAEYDAWHKWHKQNGDHPQQECNQGPIEYQEETQSQEIDKNFEVGTEIPPCSHKYPIPNFDDTSRCFFRNDNVFEYLNKSYEIAKNGGSHGYISWTLHEDGYIEFQHAW